VGAAVVGEGVGKDAVGLSVEGAGEVVGIGVVGLSVGEADGAGLSGIHSPVDMLRMQSVSSGCCPRSSPFVLMPPFGSS